MSKAEQLQEKAGVAREIESDIESLQDARLSLEGHVTYGRYAEEAIERAMDELEDAEQELREMLEEL